MLKPTPTSHIGAAFVVGAEALAIGHQRRAQAIAQARRAAGLPQPLEAGNRVTAHRPRIGTFAPARFAMKRWLAIPALALVAAMLGMATRAHADRTAGERTPEREGEQPIGARAAADVVRATALSGRRPNGSFEADH